jgi:hypothetical protein
MADYAVVVGIAHYPGLTADGATADLDGPDNDAESVHEWLTSPAGGRIPPANIKLIKSSDFSPPDPLDPQPAVGKVEQALKWIEQQTRTASGDRLYLYFSGHGFSPVLEEGALFTAEATQVSPSYVYAHDWLRWFRKAQRFREFVLWMDCCMNYQQSIPVNAPNMRPEIRNGVPGPAFIAVAAQTKSALEDRMSDGLVHGVFTWTLLQALRAGASDERGRVTGESLKNFLHTSMPEFLPERVKTSAVVDLQPFIRADDGMVFLRLAARPKYPVHLTLPASTVGEEIRIWGGRPHTRLAADIVTDAGWTGDLVRGLYLAEVPAARLRHGFQVTGTGGVSQQIQQQGPPVVPAQGSELFELDITTKNAASTITVVDHNFQRVITDTGEIHERDMPGVYKVRVEIGRDVGTTSEEILLLDRDVDRAAMSSPALPSPAPLPGSAFTHESHAELFAGTALRSLAFPGQSAAIVSVLSRYWTDASNANRPTEFADPMQGLDFLDNKGTRVPLIEMGGNHDSSLVDPVAVWEDEVQPGVHFLRLTLDNGRMLEGSVVACSGWITQISLQRFPSPLDQTQLSGSSPLDVAVFMRRPGQEVPPTDQDSVTEGARLALAQGRNLLSSRHGNKLQKLLLDDYDDPIAAIIGSHLLLMALDADPARNPKQAKRFDAAVARLQELIGARHPDVAALSLRCAEPSLRAGEPFTAPPMFDRSWQLITEASYRNPELVPTGLWDRVHASTSIGPFFVWAADDATRTAHAGQLAAWAVEFGQGRGAASPAARPAASLAASPAARPAARPAEAMAALPGNGRPAPDGHVFPEDMREAARQLHIPAAAAAGIWTDLRAAPPPG